MKTTLFVKFSIPGLIHFALDYCLLLLTLDVSNKIQKSKLTNLVVRDSYHRSNKL